MTEAVRCAVEDAGYFFGMGRDAELAVALPELPAAWMSPPELEKSSGRAEKHDVYGVRVRLMMSRASTPDGEAAAWEILESDALAVCDAVRMRKA